MIDSIVGVDHIGIGVRDMAGMRSFYAEVLGYDRILAEMPEADHPAIRGLLRAPRAVHSATLLGSDHGGLTVALFHAVEPVPRPVRADPRYGDIGVAKVTFGVPDLAAFSAEMRGLAGLCSTPRCALLEDGGEYRFAYGRDPEGNLIEVFSDGGTTGCPAPVFRSIGIAVTDLDRSLAFYQDILGFDRTVVAPHEAFSGLIDEITGERGATARSCLVANSDGGGMLEILEVTKPRGRSIPFGAQWGDFGYLQICLRGADPQALAAEVEAARLDVLLPLQEVDDPERPAVFMYVRDPDGIPVEIVA